MFFIRNRKATRWEKRFEKPSQFFLAPRGRKCSTLAMAARVQLSASEHNCGSAWFLKRSKTSLQNAKKSRIKNLSAAIELHSGENEFAGLTPDIWQCRTSGILRRTMSHIAIFGDCPGFHHNSCAYCSLFCGRLIKNTDPPNNRQLSRCRYWSESMPT